MDWGGVWQALGWLSKEIDCIFSLPEQQYHVIFTNSAGKSIEQFPCGACAVLCLWSVLRVWPVS